MLEQPHLGQFGDMSTLGFHPLSITNVIHRLHQKGNPSLSLSIDLGEREEGELGRACNSTVSRVIRSTRNEVHARARER